MTTAFRSILCFAVSAAASLAQSIVLPHVAWGGGWTANIVVVNLDTGNPASPAISFYADDGSALSTPVNGGGTVSSYSFSLAPSGSVIITLPNTGSTATSGSGILNGNGVAIAASIMYTWHNPPNADFSITVPGIPSAGASCIISFPGANPSYLLAFDGSNDGHTVGLAFSNSDPANSATPTIQAIDQSGNLLGSAKLSLPAHGHSSFILTDKIPAAAGHKGTIMVSADIGVIGGLALQVFPNGTIASVLPLKR